jgi:hypothetical protein
VSYRVDIRPEALADIAQAAAWYEERQAGLGARFTCEVIAATDGLWPNSLLYPLRHRRLGARWCLPDNFPYRIVYRVTDKIIAVVAVVRATRHDWRWKERL